MKTQAKKFKRLLSILLAVMLLLSAYHVGLFGITVSADTVTGTSGYYSYTVSNSAAEITDVDASISGDIIIPSELGGYTVTSIGSYAFYNCTSLTDVYYTGTEDEWNSIFVGSNNTCLTDAAIHCNYTHSTSVLGDLNGDGSITADDLAAMRKAILKGETAVNADMNIDGAVNIKNLIALKKLLA